MEPEAPKDESAYNPFVGSENRFQQWQAAQNAWNQQANFQYQSTRYAQQQNNAYFQYLQGLGAQQAYYPPTPQLTPEQLQAQQMAPVWRKTLGFDPSALVTLDEVETSFRTLAKTCHPDRGGDPEQMKQLNLARAWAKRELSAVN